MATQWLRRAWLLAACASTLLLSACGGGDIVDQLNPARVIGFGDAVGDMGQNGARYTVNDGGVNTWAHYVASRYGRELTASSSGGLGFAFGNARVAATPDAAGNAATPTVQDQVTAFLAGGAPGPDDLILVSAGTSDVIVQARAVMEGRITEQQALENLEQAARDLAAQVRRLVAAGAQHVAVVGTYNLARSAWAAETGQGGLLQRLSTASGNTSPGQPRSFNERLLVSMVDLGENVLYVDAALLVNLVAGRPDENALADVTNPVCTSVDPGEGIGTGPGQVNSNLCTPDTLRPGADPGQFLFADRVYLTPRGNQLLGDFAFERIRDRW